MMQPTSGGFRAWLKVAFERLCRVPLGVWAALSAAFMLLELYLNGRRLDAELGQEKLRHVRDQARASRARDAFRQEEHMQRVQTAQRRIEEIETVRSLATASGEKESRRLHALNSKNVHAEYMRLLRNKWESIARERTLPMTHVAKITMRPLPKKPPAPPEPPDVRPKKE